MLTSEYQDIKKELESIRSGVEAMRRIEIPLLKERVDSLEKKRREELIAELKNIREQMEGLGVEVKEIGNLV